MCIAGTPSSLPDNWLLLNGHLAGPHADLADANLGGVDLGGADLSGVASGGVTGTPAALPANWSLVQGYLIGPGASLVVAKLSGADLTGADLTNATDLTITNLSDADLSAANLTNANLSAATLTDANLAGANLTSTRLDGADLDGVSSGGITTTPAALPGTWILRRGYLIGPGANLTGANLAGINLAGFQLSGLVLKDTNLANANLSNAFLSSTNFDGANLKGTNLAGADLNFVTSGGVTGTPAALPAGFSLVAGYLIGPFDSLANANLNGADLTGVDLFSTDLSGAHLAAANLAGANMGRATLSNAHLAGANLNGASLAFATMPSADLSNADLTNADLDNASADHIIMAGAKLTSADLSSANLGSADLSDAVLSSTKLVSTALSFADLTGATITNADFTGANLFGVTATGTTWSNSICPDGSNSDKHVKGCLGPLDTTPPVVTVTGVANHHQYVLGAVPAARCQTTDNSVVAVPATVSVTTTGAHGVGPFVATCAGAVDQAGNAQAAPVTASYSVVYGFGGFVTPAPGSTVARSSRTMKAQFRLTNSAGTAIASTIASALAAAHDVRVTLAGPAVNPVTVTCTWNATAKMFNCPITIPARVRTGTSNRYTITAAENVGPGFVKVPAAGQGSNPEIIHFR